MTKRKITKPTINRSQIKTKMIKITVIMPISKLPNCLKPKINPIRTIKRNKRMKTEIGITHNNTSMKNTLNNTMNLKRR